VRFLACLLLVLGLSAVSTTVQAATFEELEGLITTSRLDEARRMWENLDGQRESRQFSEKEEKKLRRFDHILKTLRRIQRFYAVAAKYNDLDSLERSYEEFVDQWKSLDSPSAISPEFFQFLKTTKDTAFEEYHRVRTHLSLRRPSSYDWEDRTEEYVAIFDQLDELIISDRHHEASTQREKLRQGMIGAVDAPELRYNDYWWTLEILRRGKRVIGSAKNIITKAGYENPSWDKDKDIELLDEVYEDYRRTVEEFSLSLSLVSEETLSYLYEQHRRVIDTYERALTQANASGG